MNLHAYLKHRQESQYAFAARVGTTPATISRLIKGDFAPSLAMAAKIETATDGEVPMQSWLNATHPDPNKEAA